jgi:hypothetical protein
LALVFFLFLPQLPPTPYLQWKHPDCQFSLGWELGANWLNENLEGYEKNLELRTWLGLKKYQCWFLVKL